MYYDHKKVEWLKERYLEGTRICLDRMNDDPFPVESGVDDFHIVSEDSEQTEDEEMNMSM